MKRLMPVLILSFFIILGTSFIIMVLRMVWFPPSPMGMMMGRDMMFHHMISMFGQTFLIFLLIIGFLIILWFIKRKKK